MKIIWKLLVCFFLLVSIASATDLSYIDTGDYILFEREDGLYINLTGQQNFSEFNFTTPTLNITVNESYSTYNNSANITLSNITYLNDKLNFTGSATSGTLNISAKMLNNNRLYYLFADGTKNTTYTSNSTGWVNFNWSNWSQHDLSIQPDVSVPALTAQSISPASVQQGYSSTVTAEFTDDNSVSSAKVRIRNPDGSEFNWTMTCTAGASVTCTKEYISTVILGVYSITNYFPKDNSNNEANITSSLTFEVTAMPQGGSGGGGSGGGTTIIIKETENATAAIPLLTLKNITVNATDSSGNLASQVVNYTGYTPSSYTPSSSGGGGSGGGGVVTDEDFSNVNNFESKDVNLLAGKEARFDFNKVGAGIFYAIVTGKENEYDVTIRVENLKAQPKKATTPAPNTVYLYTNILSGSQRIASGKIGFKVPNTWLASNNIAPGAVKMYRLQDGKWNALETKQVGTDAENSIYEAATTGFSKFAITGEVPSGGVAPVPSTPAVPTPAQTVVEQTIPTETILPVATPQTPGFSAVFGLIGLVAAIYIVRKGRL